jgi:hypothetical protein
MFPISSPRPSYLAAIPAAVFAILFSASAANVKSITQYGITWTFDKEVPSGQFCTGDFWVVGPVTITGISTDLHAPGFEPKPGEDGSMVNPGTTDRQGYDNRVASYDPALNAALPNGQPISTANPLILQPNSSLVSMVSWLYRSPEDTEPGTPKFNDRTKAPRPVTRSGAVLTVLAAPAPEGSFRPPYCGDDKSIKFNVSNLDLSPLKNLTPVTNAPDVGNAIASIQRPWIEHVYQWLGAAINPSENMPDYGREKGKVTSEVALLLNMDFSQLPGGHSKQELLIPYVQLGIDLAGVADNGGGWPSNGGHHTGRKLPILVAGYVLNDPHMKDVGNWKTEFHEDQQTFIVSQEDVDLTNSGSGNWKPDRRADPEPYAVEDIGMPEWGGSPDGRNKNWKTPYRAVNFNTIISYALAARIMGLEKAWNHPPLFAYADRVMEKGEFESGPNRPSPFIQSMWEAYPSR